MKLFCDGSGFNGRTGSYVVTDETGKVLVHKIYEEEVTNNEMEYMAVLKALEMAQKGDIVYSDSQLVVYQVAGKWKVKEPRLKQHAIIGKALYKFKKAKLEWIPRDENKAGHYLEKNH